MTKNAIQSYLENSENQDKVNKAKERFNFKPFYQKYRQINKASKVLIFLLPSISIITGTVFLGTVLSYLLPYEWLAMFFGLLLVVLLEYLKSYLLSIGLTDFFAKVKGSILVLGLSLVFCVLSAFLSLQGIREIHKNLDTSLQDLSTNQTSQTDSLNRYFDKQIQQAKAELKDFKNAISWNGKIDTRNKENNKTLQNFSSQIQNLQQDKKRALQQLHKSQNTQYKVLERANGMNLTVIFLIVLSIEILILLSNWFLIFYDFKTQKESDTLQFGQNQILVSSSDFGQMVKQFFLSSQDLNLLSQDLHKDLSTKIIGFQNQGKDLPKTYTQENDKTNSDLAKSYIQENDKPYTSLIEAIQNGETHRPTLTKKYRVSINVVNDLIKRYGVKSK